MKLKYIISLLVSMQFWGFSYAAEDAVPSEEADSIEPELTILEDEESSEPAEDRFIPSTQISEDLSVSFPVDI